MSRRAHLSHDVWLYRHESLDTHVLDAGENLIVVDTNSLVLLTQHLETPLLTVSVALQ